MRGGGTLKLPQGFKPRYKLVGQTIHAYLFQDVNAPGLGVTWYVCPRYRWALMCTGRWPW